MSEQIRKIIDECTQCNLCISECEYLARHCDASPADLAERFAAGELDNDIAAIFTCNICGLCAETCPEGLDFGAASLELRQEYVERNGKVSEAHEPLLGVQATYTADNVRTARGGVRCEATDKPDGATTVFFPGCSLSMNSPELVKKLFSLLQDEFPGIGVVTGCCGAPTHLIGEKQKPGEIFQDIVQSVRSLGATTIVAACSSCVKLLKRELPADLRVASLYRVLGDLDLPRRPGASHVFNIHDPCSSRGDTAAQAGARKIVAQLGYAVEELAHSRNLTQCCGMGGMAFIVDGDYSAAVAKRTLDEANRDLIVYCATCRVQFFGQGARVIHLLELLFNDKWEDALVREPLSFEEGVKNLAELKNYFDATGR